MLLKEYHLFPVMSRGQVYVEAVHLPKERENIGFNGSPRSAEKPRFSKNKKQEKRRKQYESCKWSNLSISES